MVPQGRYQIAALVSELSSDHGYYTINLLSSDLYPTIPPAMSLFRFCRGCDEGGWGGRKADKATSLTLKDPIKHGAEAFLLSAVNL